MLEMFFAIDPRPIEAALSCTTCIDRCLDLKTSSQSNLYKVALTTKNPIVVMLRSPYLVKFTTAHMNSLTFLMDY